MEDSTVNKGIKVNNKYIVYMIEYYDINGIISFSAEKLIYSIQNQSYSESM